jgi:2-succinyl-6-hydroxy-2,4-cyclohexadiene-1-carboxylate synthase
VNAPLVLLHGFTGHADCWTDVRSRMPTRQTHAYTLLGHEWDRPVPNASGSSFEDEVDRIAALVRRDCSERACLCGYSLGGRVALVLLVRHPELFASAVIVGASPGLQSNEERSARARSDAQWIEMVHRLGVGAFVEAWEAQPLFASQRRLPMAVQLEQKRRRERHDAEGLASAMRALGLAAMPDMWPELPTIAVPVHLVVGELDTKFRETAGRMLPSMPGARLSVIADAGHNVVLEKPGELAELLAGT